MIQYSSGTLINRTFSPVTRADWCNNVTQALADAGWTTISGVPGSGSDVTMETAAPAYGAGVRCRVLDPGSGNCAQTTIKNASGTIVSNIAYALPSAGSGQWRVIANKYHFFSFATGNANAQAARGYVAAGTLWVPAFMGLQSTDPVGWLWYYGFSDIDPTASWIGARTFLRPVAGAGAANPYYGIWQANGVGRFAASTNNGDPSVAIVWQGGRLDQDRGYRWTDNTLMIYEPFTSWATGTAVGNESKLKGQLYDAAIISGAWSGESTIQFDGHTWLCITNGPTANNGANAVLFLAIT